MRDIKFRFWHKRDRAMLTKVKTGLHVNENFMSDSLIAMQFTGLKDINGIEIYDGDVIKSHFYGDDAGFECVAQIKYSSARAAFVFDSSEQDAFVYDNESNLLEVIGNIYENPELLK